MDALKQAIDKAMQEQYPKGAPSSATFISYEKDEKKSQRARWNEHFQLQLKSAGYTVYTNGPYKYSALTFKPMDVYGELIFHSERMWRMDFAIPFDHIAIEIEGGIWMQGKTGHGGAHSLPTNILRDIEKQNAAVLLGWHPLRFSPKEIRDGTGIQTLISLHQKLRGG